MNKSFGKLITLGVIALLSLFVASNAFFIVNEGEQAIVTRFGRILPRDYSAPGLKIKVPFIDKEQIYLKKLLSWDGQVALLPTSDDKRVLLDTTAYWRIENPKVFYSKLSNLRDAYGKLDDIIDKRVRAVIGRYPMVEIVRMNNDMLEENLLDREDESSDSSYDLDNTNYAEMGFVSLSREPNIAIPEVNAGRLNLEEQILERSRQEVNPESLGIYIVDVLIRQVQYPDNVAAKAYERMASERKKRAAEARSRGEGERAKWLGRLEKERQTIVAQAEAEASRIFREAYSKDADFYQFWRAMDSYSNALMDVDKILTTDMEYFDYLYGSDGNR